MLDEDRLLPISALQHLLFCPRQCALIHLEGLWAENRLTVEGSHMHRRAHEPTQHRPSRSGVRCQRGLELCSRRLGLFGRADVVEFHPTPAGDADGREVPYPVEYKRGRPKDDDCDRVQLCAQALCLEEMTGRAVLEGAIFYGRTRRREVVAFDAALRRRTEQAAHELHALIRAGRTPSAQREKKCDRCSMLHLCLPDALRPRRTPAAYLRQEVAAALGQAGA